MKNATWSWLLIPVLVIMTACAPQTEEAEIEEETTMAGEAAPAATAPDLQREADLRTAEGAPTDWQAVESWDIDRDDQITEEEFNENYAQLTADWDVDGDGTLGPDEMADTWFDLFDGNDDDLIDESEFETARKWEAGAEWGNFLDFDTDGDSHLGQTEYDEWFNEQAWDATWDVDGDGVLGPDEQADTFWDFFDLNDDNLIDAEELGTQTA